MALRSVIVYAYHASDSSICSRHGAAIRDFRFGAELGFFGIYIYCTSSLPVPETKFNGPERERLGKFRDRRIQQTLARD